MILVFGLKGTTVSIALTVSIETTQRGQFMAYFPCYYICVKFENVQSVI